jgi:4a-hydroxytetrahydrobiopterin dehydratase
VERLPEEEAARRAAALDGWTVEGGALTCERTFADFAAAVAFVNRVAALAEAQGHHPDIDIRYRRVRLALTTHDAGGLTGRDFDLAARIDALPGGGAP